MDAFRGFVFDNLANFVAYTVAIMGTVNQNADLLKYPNPVKDPMNSYDFIIVGGGSAGGVLADRLSADGKHTVLLLEAGGDPLLIENIPLMSGFIPGHIQTDWNYRTVPQNNSCFAHEDQRMPWPRGKSLGGTSNLNHMMYMRGSPRDFDNWAKVTKDDQWTYDNLLPFFKKSEYYNGRFEFDEKYHGREGLLYVENQNSYEPLKDEWIEGGKEAGLPFHDPNARQTEGVYYLELNYKDGWRWEVFDAFIKPALKRPNLTVKRYATALRVLLDKQNTATGVEYIRHGKLFKAKAKLEVIVSCGSLGSPRLLLSSGIGPKEHLKSVGVTPKVDLPGVGENLQDHVITFLGPFYINEGSFLAERDIKPMSLIEFYNNGSGVLSYTYVSGLATVSTTGHDKDWPNFALVFAPMGVCPSFPHHVSAIYGWKLDVLKKFYGTETHDSVFLMIYIGLPSSTGNVRLSSSNPLDPPLLDPKYYSDPDDMKVMLEGIRVSNNMMTNTPTWKKLGAKLHTTPLPGCEKHKIHSDEYYECYARTLTGTIWHQSCTCKMGADDDKMAVLDSHLRVRKVKHLRVADASSMPKITTTNTNAPTIVIAEKAADLILKDHK